MYINGLCFGKLANCCPLFMLSSPCDPFFAAVSLFFFNGFSFLRHRPPPPSHPHTHRAAVGYYLAILVALIVMILSLGGPKQMNPKNVSGFLAFNLIHVSPALGIDLFYFPARFSIFSTLLVSLACICDLVPSMTPCSSGVLIC